MGGRIGLLLAIAVPLAAADPPLFPQPLHIIRRIEDPIANTASQVDEYCTGNQIITIDGYKTIIVDYAKQELLQIDRSASTYSVARFDEIAAAHALTRSPARKSSTRVTTTALGVKTSLAGRSADAFEIAAGAFTIDFRVDRQISVSRRAFDALTGASFPNEPDSQHEAIAGAAMRPSISSNGTDGSFGIPLEQSITFATDRGTPLTIRNVVVRIDDDLPPSELLAIPAGAKLVPSRAERLRKSIGELKDLAPHP